MLFFSGVVLILTSACIFLQKFNAKSKKSISVFTEGNFLKDKDLYNETVGKAFLILGLLLMITANRLGEGSPFTSTVADIVIIFIMLIIVVLLLVIHNIIVKRIFKNKRSHSKIVDFNSDMQLPQKIQSYMETKRQKSTIFHNLYQVLLSFIFTNFICMITLFKSYETQQIIEFLTLFVATMSLSAILITLTLIMKQLFLTEINKADNFLLILFELDRSLVDEELNRINLFENKVDKRTTYNFLLGALLAILLVSFITKV